MRHSITGTRRLILTVQAVGIVLALAILAALALLPWVLAFAWAWRLTGMTGAVLVLGLGIYWLRVRPRTRRDWVPDHALLPDVQLEGDIAVIEGFRHRHLDQEGRSTLTFTRRRIDLADVQSVEFGIERLGRLLGVAHTFLSFGLASGDYLSVSAEARRRVRQRFSAVQGLLRTYQLMYVIGDEKDVVGLRTTVRKHPVILYPLRVQPETARRLLRSMLERARELRQRPEHYNTVTNSCATSLVQHLEELSGRRIGLDPRILLPGYSDRIAHELELLAIDGDLQTARERYQVQPPSFDLPPRDWSRLLRESRGRGATPRH